MYKYIYLTWARDGRPGRGRTGGQPGRGPCYSVKILYTYTDMYTLRGPRMGGHVGGGRPGGRAGAHVRYMYLDMYMHMYMYMHYVHTWIRTFCRASIQKTLNIAYILEF